MEIALQHEKIVDIVGYKRCCKAGSYLRRAWDTQLQTIMRAGPGPDPGKSWRARAGINICDDDLQCCGRHCCIPEDPVIPLWLIIVLIFIALLLLAEALALAAYMCSKRRKPKPKKGFEDSDISASKGGYSALAADRDAINGNGFGCHDANRASDRAILVRDHDAYSTPENLYGTGRGGGAYGNESYSHSGSRYGPVAVPITRAPYDYRAGYGRDYGRYGPDGDSDGGVSHRVPETVEESFNQEITYERPASTDSREML